MNNSSFIDISPGLKTTGSLTRKHITKLLDLKAQKNELLKVIENIDFRMDQEEKKIKTLKRLDL